MWPLIRLRSTWQLASLDVKPLDALAQHAKATILKEQRMIENVIANGVMGTPWQSDPPGTVKLFLFFIVKSLNLGYSYYRRAKWKKNLKNFVPLI